MSLKCSKIQTLAVCGCRLHCESLTCYTKLALLKVKCCPCDLGGRKPTVSQTKVFVLAGFLPESMLAVALFIGHLLALKSVES